MDAAAKHLNPRPAAHCHKGTEPEAERSSDNSIHPDISKPRNVNSRGLLRRQIKGAWCEVMRGAYAEQVINSERALQVHLSAYLLNSFQADAVNRRLFVEPNIRANTGEGRIHPDLLVCNTRQVIGVIEIKYQPHRHPQYAKDLQSLTSIAWETENLEITNFRYRGPGRGQQCYTVAKDALFVWSGVYRAPYIEIPEEGPPTKLADKLMVLHAVCQRDAPPSVYQGDRRIRVRDAVARTNADT